MDFKQAIAALNKLEAENIPELVSAIEGHVSKLENKNFEVIGEKRSVSSRAQTLETALTSIAKAIGLEGDLEAVLAGLDGKIAIMATDLKAAQTKATDLETRATTAETKLTSLERRSTLAQAAAKAGAVPEVLERLLGDKIGELAIAEDGVKLGDKPLKEYIEADEALKPFLPALFPAAATTTTQQKLPSGAPAGGKPEEKKDPVAAYASRAYSGHKAFTPKSN